MQESSRRHGHSSGVETSRDLSQGSRESQSYERTPHVSTTSSRRSRQEILDSKAHFQDRRGSEQDEDDSLMKAQMKALQQRMANLGRQINDMQKRTDTAEVPPSHTYFSSRVSEETFTAEILKASVTGPPKSSTYPTLPHKPSSTSYKPSLLKSNSPGGHAASYSSTPTPSTRSVLPGHTSTSHYAATVPHSTHQPSSYQLPLPTFSQATPSMISLAATSGSPSVAAPPSNHTYLHSSSSHYHDSGLQAFTPSNIIHRHANSSHLPSTTTSEYYPRGSTRSPQFNRSVGSPTRGLHVHGSLQAALSRGPGGINYQESPGPGQPIGDASANALQHREVERLKSWIQEMRSERRRLEDRLLNGEAQSQRSLDMRDELENQVVALSRQRDVLEAEVTSIMSLQQLANDLTQEVHSLKSELSDASDSNAHYAAQHSQLHAAVAEASAQLDALTAGHEKVSRKYKKAVQKLEEEERTVHDLSRELDTTQKELQARESSLSELKASSEVLQHASSRMQQQTASRTKELEGLVITLQQQLAEEQSRNTGALRMAEDSAREVKELSSRAEFLRSEREKALKLLQNEQQQGSVLKKSIEALQAQKTDLDMSARSQLEALQKQFELQASAASRQYEFQVSSVEKQYTSLQKQYDAAVLSHEKLVGLHNGLRKERDELWQEVEQLRRNNAALQRERDELVAKLVALRGEAKYSVEDVVQDRDQRLRALTDQHEQLVMEVRSKYEKKILDMVQGHDNKLRGMMDLLERLKEEHSSAVHTSENQRNAVAHLKQQLQEALVNRDDILKDLEAEREFSKDLNKIVNQIRGHDVERPPSSLLRR
ncbi:hypothetical protein CEUSTIGMA_g520.t1 [Chlamydomonas eustigma]|uniref:Uncharacterized protein n=1 Tax=Chlamydomonas eustigma TaxID=1157962 RepID=A0A250WQE8_9CHLO|nr:hypothetical protein CEUSTIGMA_g520.t1 [Chlamydomonas eustigma]|eukprot:GAX73067.1 hypothetical protein CEUSTIGMA_g520.t1 [Chlamydomonas eustigma]